MPRIICCKCEVEYVPDRNGVEVLDLFLNPPQPYKLTTADRFVCPGCGHRVIAGFAPVSHYHHEPDFVSRLEKVRAIFPDADIQLVYEHPVHPDEEEK